ncbi:hypothetical protein [Nitrosomonas sp.]|uniref:hypothetical protein n=1 Tax=Nitrosomonas sp. TaxID=42353 RepID=UPI001E04BBDB|nr:hypothetical protein [Nitrosomonas sp.]MBX3616104.1 hypothetical protein [Nitrosomonas sp.]
MSTKILILGYGEIGHALEFLLKKHCPVAVWDKYPSANFIPVTLEQLVPQADIALFCLPVNAHREVTQRITPHLKRNCLCISVAKGLDETGKTAAQIFNENLPPGHPHALLYGPMIAEEILAGSYAFAQLGCRDLTAFKTIQTCFDHTKLYLEHTFDIEGISWSVILKNVYAMLFGIADELMLGANMRGHLTTAALQELQLIAKAMGGQTDTPYRLSGLGDLVATATSENSHHHELGRKIAKGKTDNISGEGPHTLQMIEKHQLINIQQYPLLQLINTILHQPHNPYLRFEKYFEQLTQRRR